MCEQCHNCRQASSLKPYLPEAAAQLAEDPAVRVEFLEYD